MGGPHVIYLRKQQHLVSARPVTAWADDERALEVRGMMPRHTIGGRISTKKVVQDAGSHPAGKVRSKTW